jgi:hypothetical protein
MTKQLNRRTLLKAGGAVGLSYFLLDRRFPQLPLGLPGYGRIQAAGMHPNNGILFGADALTMAGTGLLTNALGGQMAPDFGPGLTVLQWLLRFATSVGSNIVADSVANWMRNLNNRNKQVVSGANQMMKRDRFEIYDQDIVNLSANNIHFYGVYHRNGLNACAPFYTVNPGGELKTEIMLDGPPIVGLALSAADWDNRQVSKADGLVPLKGNRTLSIFSAPQGQPVNAKTAAGNVEIGYWSDRRSKGVVSVVSRKDNGGVLFGADYELNWG